MADEDQRGRRDGSQPERGAQPDYLFRVAWEEINERMASLRLDLEMSERSGIGGEAKQALARKLVELQETVDSFAERWMDFERKRKALEDRLREP